MCNAINTLQVGRVAIRDNMDGLPALGPTDTLIPGMGFFSRTGMAPIEKPQAMTQEDINDTIADYVHAANRSGRSGFEVKVRP